jgi:hypothetical protein
MRRVEHEKRIAKCEEKEKGKSGAQTELKPHFIFRFRGFFYRFNDNTHNNFFLCNNLHWCP